MSVPVLQHLDPLRVAIGRFMVPRDSDLSTAEFDELKAAIAYTGGNLIPVMVRQPCADGRDFELIYGRRRHQACLELGLPVLALVATVAGDDRELFQIAAAENGGRQAPSLLALGVMYQRALDAGMYPSRRRLAEALGLPLEEVSVALSAAGLPAPVLRCVAMAGGLQAAHAKKIAAAMVRDPEGVTRRAGTLLRTPGRRTTGAVVKELLGAGGNP